MKKLKNKINIEKYYKLFHLLALQNARKMCEFEYLVVPHFFNKKYLFKDFIKDVNQPYLYSSKELKKIFKDVKKKYK